MKNENGISVVICCYNSARTIVRALEHLHRQRGMERIPWEVIVVNNNSSDATERLVLGFIDAHPGWPATLVREQTPGLMHARKAGLARARYALVQFCDDDNFLADNYLSAMWKAMQSATVGACGGKGVPLFDEGTTPPEWFDAIAPSYACGEQGKGDEADVPHLYGAGLCVRKALLQQLEQKGFAYLLTGRTGNRQLSGDDTELCYVIRRMGYRLRYVGEAEFGHCLSASRMTMDYVRRLYYGFGFSLPVLDMYDRCLSNRRVSRAHLFERKLQSLRDYVKLKLKCRRRDDLDHVLQLAQARGKKEGYAAFGSERLLRQYRQFAALAE